MTAEPQYLTPDEVADLLRCNPEKIYRICGEGKLRSFRFEGRRLIDRKDLDAYIQQRTTEAA